ncbi:MAG: tol-pal system protein YbgF [Desulfovibrio sp.]|jgi:tol-pal system protein YbgF|nr:tol-pal system protein YbgF [Desulfovibrio sp.]
MEKNFLLSLICIFLIGGCASAGQLQKVESAGERNEKMLRDTEHRLRDLEQGVSALGGQINDLNNRAYEVRTGSGRRTGMKVMPVPAPQTAQAGIRDGRAGVSAPQNASLPENQANSATPVTAPILPPSVPPLQAPPDSRDFALAKNSASGPKTNIPDAPGQKSGTVSPALKRQKIAGPSGSLGEAAQDPPPVALPPVEAPADPLPAAIPASGQKTANAPAPPPVPAPLPPVPPDAAVSGNIPVPSLPLSDLPLPPEHPALPPVAMPDQKPADASAMPRAPAPPVPPAGAAKSPPAGQGEEAAYKAALKLAMSGRSAEGISQFRSFLQQYPAGRYAANAEYWIGECLYAQRNYKDALAQFQLVNTRYAAHHKNADALLKAGMTLNRLGDKQGAAEKYRTLLAAFPNSEAAKRARDLGLAH